MTLLLEGGALTRGVRGDACGSAKLAVRSSSTTSAAPSDTISMKRSADKWPILFSPDERWARLDRAGVLPAASEDMPRARPRYTGTLKDTLSGGLRQRAHRRTT